VQVRKDESQHEQFEARVEDAALHLGDQLGLEAELADKLFRAGGVTLEMVTQMPAEYIAGALEIEAEQAQAILEVAQNGGVASASGESNDTPAEEPTAPAEDA